MSRSACKRHRHKFMIIFLIPIKWYKKEAKMLEHATSYKKREAPISSELASNKNTLLVECSFSTTIAAAAGAVLSRSCTRRPLERARLATWPVARKQAVRGRESIGLSSVGSYSKSYAFWLFILSTLRQTWETADFLYQFAGSLAFLLGQKCIRRLHKLVFVTWACFAWTLTGASLTSV